MFGFVFLSNYSETTRFRYIADTRFHKPLTLNQPSLPKISTPCTPPHRKSNPKPPTNGKENSRIFSTPSKVKKIHEFSLPPVR
jgi:hypothetical protein